MLDWSRGMRGLTQTGVAPRYGGAMVDRHRTEDLRVTPIGVIRTQRRTWVETPVQAALNAHEPGEAHLAEEFVDALEGLAEFDYAWLLTWLGTEDHDPSAVRLRQVPFLAQASRREIGILAMRGPKRPNPVGLSLVRILGIDAAVIHFSGVDMVDGTPLLDVKPYVVHFDRPELPVRSGWFDDVQRPAGATPSMLANDDHGPG